LGKRFLNFFFEVKLLENQRLILPTPPRFALPLKQRGRELYVASGGRARTFLRKFQRLKSPFKYSTGSPGRWGLLEQFPNCKKGGINRPANGTG
ncbi:hypothetical protein, partial [Microbulbifer celer]